MFLPARGFIIRSDAVCVGLWAEVGLPTARTFQGWHEADDLRIVLLHLRRRSDVGSLIVWGHSMGAAAVIYYQGRYLTKKNVTAPRLDACVQDSAVRGLQGELAPTPLARPKIHRSTEGGDGRPRQVCRRLHRHAPRFGFGAGLHRRDVQAARRVVAS